MRPSTERFSDRVDHYVRFRPSYPPDVVDLLKAECGLDGRAVVADIGSGPGNLTALLLPIAETVYGVEPNAEMRQAGERLLSSHPNFVSVDGTAENTRLASASVDLITAGQAFHWFDRKAARSEFLRIGRGDHRVALVWNTRLTDTTPFLRGYEALLKEVSEEYRTVDHRNTHGNDELASFFGRGKYKRRVFPYVQDFDYEGFLGRVLSSSYVPTAGPGHERMIQGVERLYAEHNRDGQVAFEYQTEVFYGSLEHLIEHQSVEP